MRKVPVLAVVLVCCACGGGLAESLTVVLDPVDLPDKAGDRVGKSYGMITLPLKKASPVGAARPADAGPGLRQGVVPLGEGGQDIAFAIDRHPETGWYERLWVDWNGDKALTPQELISARAEVGKPVDIHPGGLFTPVSTVFRVEMPVLSPPEAEAAPVFELSLREYRRAEAGGPGKEEAEPSAALHSTRCRRGRCTVGRKAYEVTLLDLNVNGRYNDFARTYGSGDGAVFQEQGDGAEHESRLVEPLNGFRGFGEELYDLAVAADGSELTLSPSLLPKGWLVMHPAPYSLNLRGEGCNLRIRNEEKVALPAGRYEMVHVMYRQRGEDGQMYTLSGISVRDPVHFTIKEGKKTSAPFGPPFTAGVAWEMFRKGYHLSADIRGAAGESYAYSTEEGLMLGATPSGELVLRARSGKLLARIKRNARHSVDAIPPDFSWAGPLPERGITVTPDLGLPWKMKIRKTVIEPGQKKSE